MKFITIQKQDLQNNLVSIKSEASFDSELNQIIETVDIANLRDILRLPPKKIVITVNRCITEVLLQAITPSYLRGSQIVINNVAFEPCKSNPQYFYKWVEQIPSTLPQHLKDAYRAFKLRDELYQELVEWNQSRIRLAEEHSKFKWSFAETFYKEVFKTFHNTRVRTGNPKKPYCTMVVQSPNQKTFYEAVAELAFESYCPQAKALSSDEQRNIDIINTQRYAQAFGLQDTTIDYAFRHRTTKHGTTDEITVVSGYDIENAITSDSYMRHTNQQREGYIGEDGFETFIWLSKSRNTVSSHVKERENIQTIKWILSLDKDTQKEFLAPGWHFCPICNKLYHENTGCYGKDKFGNEVVHVDEITFVPYKDDCHDNEEGEYNE